MYYVRMHVCMYVTMNLERRSDQLINESHAQLPAYIVISGLGEMEQEIGRCTSKVATS